MFNIKSITQTISLAVFGWTFSALVHAQANDKRWQPLADGVMVDSSTFQASTVDSGEYKGNRWIDAWVMWTQKNGSKVRARMEAVCESRHLQISEQVLVGVDGTENYTKAVRILPVVPNGDWEELHTGLCKRGKQWWKVWK